MSIAARYHDGLVAAVHVVGLDYERIGDGGTLVIRAADRSELARWPAADLFAVHGRRDELRLGVNGQPTGARVVVRGSEYVGRVLATLPVLHERRRRETGREIRLAVTATVALASVIGAYLYGVPMLASRIVGLVPPAWETSLGETVAAQMEASLGDDGLGFEVCDTNPDSLANRAIARFGAAAMEGTGSPFTLDIKVVRSSIPNAFALPGGQVFFFSGLLEQAETQDEFAGVLAHEVGHVAHRHGMEQLISTAGTGALIGFILGDMTGISVAAGLGATIIDARFSRDAERQADAFAARVADRMDFNPAGLADLINRVGADDEFTRALALLSTHPLTQDRKAALEIMSRQRPTGLEPPFTVAEWLAIRTMCGPDGAVTAKTKRK